MTYCILFEKPPFSRQKTKFSSADLIFDSKKEPLDEVCFNGFILKKRPVKLEISGSSLKISPQNGPIPGIAPISILPPGNALANCTKILEKIQHKPNLNIFLSLSSIKSFSFDRINFEIIIKYENLNTNGMKLGSSISSGLHKFSKRASLPHLLNFKKDSVRDLSTGHSQLTILKLSSFDKQKLSYFYEKILIDQVGEKFEVDLCEEKISEKGSRESSKNFTKKSSFAPISTEVSVNVNLDKNNNPVMRTKKFSGSVRASKVTFSDDIDVKTSLVSKTFDNLCIGVFLGALRTYLIMLSFPVLLQQQHREKCFFNHSNNNPHPK